MAFVALLALGAGAQPAQADDIYTVYTCHGPDGKGNVPHGWSPYGASVERRGDCSGENDISAGPTNGDYSKGQAFGWRFDAPPETRIVAWTLYRSFEVTGGAGWAWNWNLFRDDVNFDPAYLVESCWASSAPPCHGFGDGKVSAASRVGQSNVDLARLFANIDCSPGPCPAGSRARMRIHRGDFTLRDTSDPSFVGTPSGDLLDTTKPVTGVQTAAYSATDRGGGVYRVILEVDGRQVASETADDNGGLCRKPFTSVVPCRGNVSGTLAFDTSKLADGQHTVRLLVTDATDTNVAVHGPLRITTLNTSPVCDPAIKPSRTPVMAGFRGTKRSSVVRRRGGATIVGRIAGAGPGTQVFLLSRHRRDGAPARFAGSAVVAPSGRFSLAVPRGPSRHLRAAYKPSGNAALVCSKRLAVRVPARATLRASPSRVRAGHSVRLIGRLLGGHVPRRGQLVIFEGRSGGKWRTFATARANRRGRFVGRYRFVEGAASATYPMRVRVRPGGNYPFETGYSRTVKVRVRG